MSAALDCVLERLDGVKSPNGKAGSMRFAKRTITASYRLGSSRIAGE
jgi:hypothetical protein